jgi:16S rRNA (adenine1518-N6/adenine1519-N6)-dimethyltransferase
MTKESDSETRRRADAAKEQDDKALFRRASASPTRHVAASSARRVSSSSTLRAKKSFGQNFLADERVVERIVREVHPSADETIVEIGPGRGALTSKLIERAGRLIAVEFDRDLIPLLRERFGERENFRLIEGDALALGFCDAIAPASHARVVANLPYYISTAILQRLIEQRRCLTEMVLMLQREVVERILAEPGTSERGFLSVLVQAYCEAEALFDVAPGAFRPVPKVWSTVVRLRVRPSIAAEVQDEDLLWLLVSAGFAQRRKTILNNLRRAPGQLLERIESAGGAGRLLESAGIEPGRRAETFSLEEWARLSNALKS